MQSIQVISAEARGFAKAAKNAEERRDFRDAREFYLRAARRFNDASTLNSNEVERNTQQELAKYYFNRAMSLGNDKTTQQKSDAQLESMESVKDFFVHEKPKVGFKDIGGLEAVKEELRRAIIYPFTHKDIYEYYNQKSGGGVLLYGPPGCGKTLLGKAVARECSADFINVETSTIMNKWVGESEKSIKKLFESARGCERAIIFFDEFDAVGVRRSETEDYAKRIVNELLVQMDGIDENENILVLAATNEPWAIDPALRRPGRFKKLIFLPPPDLPARREIFKIHLKKLPLEYDVDVAYLAWATSGLSGADIQAVCSDAAEIPLQEALSGKPLRKISKSDFEKAMNNRHSSIIPWIRLAIEQVKKSGEEDLFSELIKLGKDYAGNQTKHTDDHIRE